MSSQESDYCHEILKLAILLICDNYGIKTINSRPLNVMIEFLQSLFIKIGTNFVNINDEINRENIDKLFQGTLIEDLTSPPILIAPIDRVNFPAKIGKYRTFFHDLELEKLLKQKEIEKQEETPKIQIEEESIVVPQNIEVEEESKPRELNLHSRLALMEANSSSSFVVPKFYESLEKTEKAKEIKETQPIDQYIPETPIKRREPNSVESSHSSKKVTFADPIDYTHKISQASQKSCEVRIKLTDILPTEDKCLEIDFSKVERVVFKLEDDSSTRFIKESPLLVSLESKHFKTDKVVRKPLDVNKVFGEDDNGEICPKCRRGDMPGEMIGCDSCNDWYHWSCVGITSEPDTNLSYFCSKCSTKVAGTFYELGVLLPSL